jgi:hypothetical protein
MNQIAPGRTPRKRQVDILAIDGYIQKQFHILIPGWRLTLGSSMVWLQATLRARRFRPVDWRTRTPDRSMMKSWMPFDWIAALRFLGEG